MERISTGTPDWVRQEFMIDSASEVAELPTTVPVGSVAYTADLASMYQFDGTEWVEIGG